MILGGFRDMLADVAKAVNPDCPYCTELGKNHTIEPRGITTDGEGLYIVGYCSHCGRDIESGDGDFLRYGDVEVLARWFGKNEK